MNSERRPELTIGMPVYNEERFVNEAVTSLLNQTFCNFELVISDNCSTDETYEILKRLAKSDSRITLTRQDRNVGATENFLSVFDKTETPFFMWAGSHDSWEPDHLDQLMTGLSSNPLIALAYSGTKIVDENGATTSECDQTTKSYTNPIGTLRAVSVVSSLSDCSMFYGIFRTHILKSCRTSVPCISSDHVILMEVALRGQIKRFPKITFARREYRKSSLTMEEFHRQQLMRLHGENFSTQLLEARYYDFFVQHLYSALNVGRFGAPLRSLFVSAAFLSRFGKGAGLGKVGRWCTFPRIAVEGVSRLVRA